MPLPFISSDFSSFPNLYSKCVFFKKASIIDSLLVVHISDRDPLVIKCSFCLITFSLSYYSVKMTFCLSLDILRFSKKKKCTLLFLFCFFICSSYTYKVNITDIFQHIKHIENYINITLYGNEKVKIL